MRCPVCLKLLGDMQEQFKAMALLIKMQPMPPEYGNARANVSCVCCGAHSVVPYHFLGHGCAHCGSFNTQLLATEGMPARGANGGGGDGGGDDNNNDAMELSATTSEQDE